MKLFYFANSRIPTEKAHGIQIVKTCQALIKQGIDLTLVVPTRFNKIEGDLNSYWGIEETIVLRKIFSLDLTYFEVKFLFLIQSFSFALSSLFFALINVKGNDIIYSRHFFFCWLLSIFKKNQYYYEAHAVPNDFKFKKRVFDQAAGIVVINQKIKDELIKEGVDNKILVASDGVDLNEFSCGNQSQKVDLRQKQSLAADSKIILYTGHLFKWKGAQVLADAAYQLKEYTFIFIGGTEEDNAQFKDNNREVSNITVLKHVPHRDIPSFLCLADVLVLPNSAKTRISKYWTSPIKMFEYMASERPIVASDLPSLREVLNESNAILVEPDNPEALVKGIKKAVEDTELAKKIAQRAFKDAQRYSWEKRASAIIKFISPKD